MEEWKEVHLKERVEDYESNQLTKLGLEGLSLGPQLPEQLLEFLRTGFIRAPQQLNVEHNKLETLPTSLDDVPWLSQLLALQCADNRLYALPQHLGALTALTRLELDRNALTYLPESIGQLKQLTHLSLDSNQLAELPSAIGDVASLEVLHLANNKLTHLPLDMSRLSRLQQLMINNNHFAAFPPVIPQITSLTSISLAFNDGIKEMAPLGALTQLKELHVEEGKKVGIPGELVVGGPAAIFAYLTFFGKFPSVRFDLERHWIPDEQASRCAICNANFTAFFRKHHCRMCGRVTCKKCTDKKHSIPPNNEGTHKVCDECYGLIGGPMSPRGSNNARAKDQKNAAKAAQQQQQEWGLTEADRQSLSADQQRSKLTAQKSDLDAQITSKTQTRTGVAKLVTFYAKDQAAQKTAMAELEQLDQALASLAAHQATVAQQLLALDSTNTAAYAEQQQEEVEQQQQQQEDEEGEQQEAGAQAAAKSPRAAAPGGQPAKAKVLYTFQAQSEGEINVFSGTIVHLAESAPNGDWWLIEFGGQSGYVPQSYLSPLY